MGLTMAMPAREIEFHPVQAIQVREGRRTINEGAVKFLMESMMEIGLKTPISIRYYEDRPSFLPAVEKPGDALVLLTGAHRLEAARRLGWEQIECVCYNICTDLEAELWEIAENLHRAELIALERSEQTARWIHLTNEDQKKKKQDGVSVQLGQKPQVGRPKGGIEAATRVLGISHGEAHRSLVVAALSPEAKQSARETGLADNRTVLLNAAKQEGAKAQVHYLQAESQKREERRQKRPNAADRIEADRQKPKASDAAMRAKPKQQRDVPADPVEMQFSRLVKAWNASDIPARERFRQHINTQSAHEQATA